MSGNLVLSGTILTGADGGGWVDYGYGGQGRRATRMVRMEDFLS